MSITILSVSFFFSSGIPLIIRQLLQLYWTASSAANPRSSICARILTEFIRVLENLEISWNFVRPWKNPGIFQNKDLCWKSPEKNKFTFIFSTRHNYMIGGNMMRQQNCFSDMTCMGICNLVSGQNPPGQNSPGQNPPWDKFPPGQNPPGQNPPSIFYILLTVIYFINSSK